MVSFLKKIVSVAAPIIGAKFGVVGSLVGNAIGEKFGGGSSGGGGGNYAGTAADPSTYINIAIPGVNYPAGQQSVSLPQYPEMSPYPTLPGYDKAPNLPYNMPLMPANMQGPTTGETAMLNAIYGAQGAQTASLDPTNPLFKDLGAAEEQLLNNDYLSKLKQLITSNRRSGRMGRGGILDPERRDESVASTILSNSQTNSLTARIMAQQKLKDYATSMLSTARQYGDAANLETGRNTAYRNDLTARLNQMRSDITNRTNVARNDFGAARKDTLDAFEYNQGLVKDKYSAQREDIIKALEMYKGISGTAQTGQQAKLGVESANDSALQKGIGDLLQQFLPTNIFGTGNGYSGGIPVGQQQPVYGNVGTYQFPVA